jgi:hypothetical protein
MLNSVRRGVAGTGLLLFAVLPLSGQYAAHVVVTGGRHAGTYDMRRPSCTIDGRSQVEMVDTTAAERADRLASLMLAPSKFALEFSRDASGQVTPASFASADASRLSGLGVLTLNYIYRDITFRAKFTGATVEGADSVHVVAAIACKGVKRVP